MTRVYSGLFPFLVLTVIWAVWLYLRKRKVLTVAEVAPLEFELNYRREAYNRVGATLVRDEAKDATLPARPPQFQPMRADHASVAKRAEELNKAQRQAGFLHYFFFPDVVSTKDPGKHCDMCARISKTKGPNE